MNKPQDAQKKDLGHTRYSSEFNNLQWKIQMRILLHCVGYCRFARHRNWLETGRVAKRKPGGALRVLSEEAVNCISNRVTASSNESVRKLL